MEKITEVEKVALTDPKYVFPFLLKYKQDGVAKSWELIGVHDSVAILIYNTDRKKIILVKQVLYYILAGDALCNSQVQVQVTFETI